MNEQHITPSSSELPHAPTAEELADIHRPEGEDASTIADRQAHVARVSAEVGARMKADIARRIGKLSGNEPTLPLDEVA